jgi:hypothetical protein
MVRVWRVVMSVEIIQSIYFDGQFWVAEVERRAEGLIEIAQYCFGSEPSNAELLEWVDNVLPRLHSYVGASDEIVRVRKPINPKRARRAAAAEAARVGLSSSAQEAMKMALIMHKQTRNLDRKRRNEEEDNRLWRLKQQKKKKRRRGF